MNPEMGTALLQYIMGPPHTAAPTWEPTRLSHIKPALTQQDIQLAARPELWHKFIVFGVENIEKVDILDAIISISEHEVIIPMMYRVEERQKGTFIARCAISVLEKLVKQGLRITTANGHVLAMDIVLGFLGAHELPINPQRMINQALTYRHENLKKILNLTDFQNDRALNSIYCPLSLPKIFAYVMKCCKVRVHANTRDNKLSIRELNLRSNGLRGIPPFEKSFNYHLAKIDLSHNKIDDINHLRYFSEYKITELWLDGNPLCTKYTTTEDYVRSVKNVFPHLQRLDGVMIGVEQKYIPVLQSSFVGDASRLSLVKQFVRHFFTFYDQHDRIVLNGLYDPDALFSTTLGSITNANHSQMTKAFASNRNLLKFVDYAKCHEFVLRGPEKIIAALRRQPPTYHNYRNFNIDIMYHGDEYVVLAIQGFFCYKEFPTIPLFFNRTFVLGEVDDNEYCIINDQYHIQSETPGMKPAGNDSKPLQGHVAVAKIQPTIFSPSERHQLLSFLRERTTMNENYCRRYLENANWDIRVALSTFMKDYTVNDVPPEAFREPVSS